MVAIKQIRRLQDLDDVDPNGLPDGGVPQYDTNASSFVVQTITAAGGGSFSAGVSNLGNTLGDTGITGSRIVLAGIGNLTLSQLTDANGGTISISGGTFAQSVQTQNLFDLTISGNTDGVGQLVSSGTLTLAGGSNITLSQNGNAISIIGGAGGGGTQTAISGLANTETTYTSGTVNLLALGNLTIRSTTGQAFQLSVAPQSVQPETQTFVGGIAGSNTTYTSGTVTITGSGIVTVQSGTGQRLIINASQSVQPETQTFVGGIAGSNTTYTSGTVSIVGSGDITVSSGTGQRIIISGSQSVQPETQTFVGGIIASDTTYTSGSVRFTGVGGGITVSSNTGQRVDLSVAAQTGTQFSAGLTNSGNTSGDTGTVGGRLLLVGTNNITMSGSTNGASMTITVSGPSVAGAQTGISGFANSETTYTSGTVKLSELGAITIRSTTGQQFQLSVNAQTDQTLGMYALGNTTGQSSSTTRDARSLSVEGAGIVSVGYSAGSLRISASQSVQPETQTFIAGVANTETTYSSGTVKLLELGAITIRSTTGNQFQLSVNSQTVESQSIGMSNVGNTSGTTGVASGGQVRFVLAGGNNITLSQSLNGASGTVTISAFTQSAESQSIGMSNIGNTSGTTGVASGAQVRFVFAGGNNITLSQSLNGASGTVTISGPNTAAQSNQTLGMYAVQNTTGQSSSTTMDARTLSVAGDGIVSVGYSAGSLRISASQSVQAETQTFIGGVANTETTYTSGTVKLLELGAITIRSTTGNQFQLSVNAQTGTQFSAGISGGNTSGDTGTVPGRVVLAGGNNITLSGSTNGSSMTITVSGGAGGGFSAGVSNIGNTSGDTGITGTRLVLSGAQSITLSQSTNASGATVAISGASTSQSVQSLGMYAVQNTTGQSSSTTMDARTLSVAGDGIVSVGYSNGSLRISASQSVQAETQTFIGGVANTETTYTSGTVKLLELGAITIRSTTGNQFQLSVNAQTAESQSIGMSNLGNTSGTTGIASGAQVRMLFAGGNNITLSQSLNGASGTITISAFNQTGTQFSGGISGGNTSGDTGTVGGRLVFAGGNNITLSGSTNGVSETITISAFTQSAESQSIGMSNLGNTAGTTGVASGAQVRFVIVGTNNISLSQSLNGASGTISVSGQPSFSGGVSTGGNTAGATGVTGTNLVFVGSNNITLSQTTGANGGTVSIFGPTPGAAQYSIGVSTGGNTAGNTGVTGTRIVFAGAGVVSLSQATDATGATISISDTVSAFQLGVSTDGNTAGATGVTGTRFVLVGSSPISLSQTTGANGGTVTINAPATSSLIGASGISVSTSGSTISVLPIQNTSFAPYVAAQIGTAQQGAGTLHLQPAQIPHVAFDRFLFGMQGSNATNSSNSWTISLYLGIYTKNASTLSLVSSISTSTNFSAGGTTGSYSLWAGPKWLSVPWTMTLSSGDYHIGIMSRTTTGGGAGQTLNNLVRSDIASAWSGLIGVGSNASAQEYLGMGVLSVSTAGIPASVAFTDIAGSASLAHHAPIWHIRSGTA